MLRESILWKGLVKGEGEVWTLSRGQRPVTEAFSVGGLDQIFIVEKYLCHYGRYEGIP